MVQNLDVFLVWVACGITTYFGLIKPVLESSKFKNSESKNFIHKIDRVVTFLLAIMLFFPTLCLIIGAFPFLLTLKFLDLFKIDISSFGFRLFNYELLVFKSSLPPAFREEVSEEVH